MLYENGQQVAIRLDQVGWGLHRHGQRGQLNKREWELLRFLDMVNGEGATAGDFAYYQAEPAHHVWKYSGELVRRGLLDRKKSKDNERSAVLSLTPRGREMLENDPLLILADRLSPHFSGDALEDYVLLLLRVLNLLVVEGMRMSAEERRQRAMRIAQSAGVGEDVAIPDPFMIQTPRKLGGPTDQARAVALLLSEAGEDVYKAGSTEELSRNDWVALRYYATSDRQEMTVGSLVGDCGINRRIASESTTRLTKELGALARKNSSIHRGVQAVFITHKGKQLLDFDPIRRLGDALEQEFSADEISVVRQLTEAVADIIRESATVKSIARP